MLSNTPAKSVSSEAIVVLQLLTDFAVCFQHKQTQRQREVHFMT